MMEFVEVEELKQIVGYSLVLALHMWAHHVHTFDHGQLAFADNTAVVVGMTVVVLAAEDMADKAVNLLADMAFVAFADIAVDREPVVDTAVGMVDADHTA